MKTAKSIISVFLITGLFAAKSDQFKILEQNSTYSKILFSQEPIKIKKDGEYSEIVTNTHSTTSEPGMPELPIHHFLFEVNFNSKVQVTYRVLSSHFEKEINIKPYQSVVLGEIENDISKRLINSQFYNSTEIYPTENLIVSVP